MVTPRIPHPANFDFGRRVTDDHLHFSSRTVQLRKARWGGKVHRIELVGTQWSPGTCHAALESPTESEITDESGFSLQVTGDGHLIVQDESGKPLLSGHPNGTFGLSGNDWMLRLEGRPGDRYLRSW